MGPANKAANFFIESPSLQFQRIEYENPADFLYDISSCIVQNKNVCVVYDFILLFFSICLSRSVLDVLC